MRDPCCVLLCKQLKYLAHLPQDTDRIPDHTGLATGLLPGNERHYEENGDHAFVLRSRPGRYHPAG